MRHNYARIRESDRKLEPNASIDPLRRGTKHFNKVRANH